MPKGVKYTTEEVRIWIEGSLSGCVVPVGWEYSDYFAKIPIFYQFNWHEITFSHWRGGARPCLLNMVDPTSFVRSKIESEGRKIPSSWSYEKWDAKIPIFNHGFLHEMCWSTWQGGARPCFVNLVDKTAFVRRKVEDEGYSIPIEWTYTKNTDSIPILENGWVHDIAWNRWMKKTRPCFKTLREKTEFVRQAIEVEGFKIDRSWSYEGSRKNIPVHFNCSVYDLTWEGWQIGVRPCFKNMQNKTSFVRDYCKKLGFSLPDEFEYQHNSTSFYVISKDKKQLKTSWWLITQDQYPGSIQRLFAARIKQVLGKGEKGSFSKTFFFGDSISLTLDNLGVRPDSGYHLDHIVPVSYFSCGTISNPNLDQLKNCWNPKNLRWLKASENRIRQNNLTESEVAHMTNDQIEILKSAFRRTEWGWTDERINAVLTSRKNLPGQLSLNLLAATH